jgi:hypothetical protein
MASCVFGAGANELAEASIVASTKVRMTAAATMLVTATGQQDSDGDRVAANSDQTPGTFSQPRTTAEGNQREKDAQRKTTVSAENTLRCTRA